MNSRKHCTQYKRYVQICFQAYCCVISQTLIVFLIYFARVAQWLERYVDIVEVEGSIPSMRTLLTGRCSDRI